MTRVCKQSSVTERPFPHSSVYAGEVRGNGTIDRRRVREGRLEPSGCGIGPEVKLIDGGR